MENQIVKTINRNASKRASPLSRPPKVEKLQVQENFVNKANIEVEEQDKASSCYSIESCSDVPASNEQDTL